MDINTGHFTSWTGLTKTILLGAVQGNRERVYGQATVTINNEGKVVKKMSLKYMIVLREIFSKMRMIQFLFYLVVTVCSKIRMWDFRMVSCD